MKVNEEEGAYLLDHYVPGMILISLAAEFKREFRRSAEPVSVAKGIRQYLKKRGVYVEVGQGGQRDVPKRPAKSKVEHVVEGVKDRLDW